ncbi:hypothetical protein GQ44DRAFT_740103 [Phaeosphaeriaceae sp. PMI808]|nr:hypothetical protein GQ44DRAFT_740103 [Phaeosphaeriaceae sp. PMI808]
MFTSHKSDAPSRSRESSVDHQATDPLSPAPTSTSETWVSQSFDESPYGAMHSPEQRHRAYSSKRSSVFKLRSRSNTSSSTTSTFLSMSPPGMFHTETSRPGTPHMFRQHGLQSQTELPGSKMSLFRGKKGKRLSDSISSGIVITEYQEKDTDDKRASVLRKTKRQSNQSEASSHTLKHRISSPFGFQHLTHTDRHQLLEFEQNSGDKLASGFRTVHSSQQQSNGQTGISDDGLHFSNFSSENLAAQGQRSPNALHLGSPPQSPAILNELQQSGTILPEQAPGSALRTSRSVESFSQPTRNYHNSQSVLAPPRQSSLTPLAPIDDRIDQENQRLVTRTSRSKRESGIWDTFSLATAAADPHLPGIRDDSIYFGHALTTPDDTAIHAMTPPFSPSLDDVAEEPERFAHPRPAPQPPMRSPATPRSPNFDSSIFYTQRSPVARVRSRGASHSSPRSYGQRSSISRPTSQMSETLGSADIVRRRSIRRPSSHRRQSNTWRVPEESWEDDIDYAYENALEADCDFEWDRASFDMSDERLQTISDTRSEYDRPTSPRTIPQPPAALQPAFDPSVGYRSRNVRISLLVPQVPDLMPTSATSASTMETGLRTPFDQLHRGSVGDPGGFMVSPSLLVPQEYKDESDHNYEDLLNAYADSERHFTMLDPRYSATSSARSRRSSYDSSLISSTQSSGMWSSPVRRSASSAGSVPELMPSRRNRHDLSFSLTMDHLSDSVSSLAHLDEEKEDDDVTPPGRFSGNRTFFPNDEELQEPYNRRLSIEDELKSSLELAQRGSQRSTHDQARHHKQTKSDGAAKLLATTPASTEQPPIKQRSRAATASQTIKSPMLSLFPAPPRKGPSSSGN